MTDTDRAGRRLPTARDAARERRSSGQQVADYLRQLILDGHLRAGDRVPQDLVAAELELSRIPVREGLIALEQDGWVTIQPNRGAYVNALDADAVRDSYAPTASSTALRSNERWHGPATSCTHRLATIVKRLRSVDDADEFLAATMEFHNAVVEASRSPRVGVMLRSARRAGRRQLLRGGARRGRGRAEGRGRHRAGPAARRRAHVGHGVPAHAGQAGRARRRPVRGAPPVRRPARRRLTPHVGRGPCRSGAELVGHRRVLRAANASARCRSVSASFARS